MLLGEPLDGAGKRGSGKVAAGQVRDLRRTRPCVAFSRLSRASRRSQGSLPQHISRCFAATSAWRTRPHAGTPVRATHANQRIEL